MITSCWGSRHQQHERRAWFAVGLSTVMMAGEIAVGWLSGSMALLADGWHMATHAAALVIAPWPRRSLMFILFSVPVVGLGEPVRIEEAIRG